jgi:hypothetical protein
MIIKLVRKFYSRRPSHSIKITKKNCLRRVKTDSRELSKKLITLTDANDMSTKFLSFEVQDVMMAVPRTSTFLPFRVKPKQHSKSHTGINFQKLWIKCLLIFLGRDNHNSKACNIYRNLLKCSACRSSWHVSNACVRSLMDVNIRLAPRNQSLQIMPR